MRNCEMQRRNDSIEMQLRLVFLIFGCSFLIFSPLFASGRYTQSLNGSGWRLWMDRRAEWKNDVLFLPAEVRDVARLPVNAPTIGWERLYATPEALAVSVPGTVEEYLTTVREPHPEDQSGVSWWVREVLIPKQVEGRRVLINFESVRMRAEVYLDGRLVAYDIVGESPFSADITPFVRCGQRQHLAVRVTHPGGNFHWQDFNAMTWGHYQIPPGRGFGGIIGRVSIDCVAPAHIADLYVQNTPTPSVVNAVVTLRAPSDKKERRTVEVTVAERANPSKVVFRDTRKISFQGDSSVVTLPVSVPDAQLWSPDTPYLYICRVSLKDGRRVADDVQRTFGFRWFEADGIGTDAVLRLNGRRVMLRSAISWGYFPATGLYATDEMATRQVLAAKQLGLNMLNFHRSIGSPVVLEHADSLGLLYYEEPGAFHSAGNDPFIRAIVNEKLQRMVRRDRSHPSLIIYNLINELGGPLARDAKLRALRMDDMRRAHALDPSRIMTYTSGWASSEEAFEDPKTHMLPFDTTLYRRGWFDRHNAGGPATYEQGFYKSPADNFFNSRNRTEVYMRGEEGAISTPPRIERIAEELRRTGKMGWDGRFWMDQYERFRSFMEQKRLYGHFATVDDLTRAMGNIQLEHQGRRIQMMRMQDVGDCYVINGWESMPYDNHSSVVDIYRHPKGDVERLAYYNQPLYVAVVSRQQVVRVPGRAAVDFYIINEKDVRGPHRLNMRLVAPTGETLFVQEKTVDIVGGDVFGQLLAEDVAVPITQAEGLCRVEATLTDAQGRLVAEGKEQVLAVKWDASQFKGSGAWCGTDNDQVHRFYQEQTGHELPAFDAGMPKLDWLVVTRSLLNAPEPVTKEFFANGQVKATWFDDDDMRSRVGEHLDDDIDRVFVAGAQPDELVPANQMFSVVWEAMLVPQESGMFLLGVSTNRGVRLDANGQRLVDQWGNNGDLMESRPVVMEAGKPVKIRVEYRQTHGDGRIQLVWTRPGQTTVAPQALLDRVKNDGTTLVLLDKSETWMKAVADATGMRYGGYHSVGTNWVGGVHFVKRHPLFSGLPADDAMNWPYQAVVRDGDNRFGYFLEGEELVAGTYRSWPFHLGTAVGVVPYGKGCVVFSTLDINSQLLNADPTAEVARKLLLNYLQYRHQE